MMGALDEDVDLDLTAQLQIAIDRDHTSYLLELRDIPEGGSGPVEARLWMSEGDVDFDGAIDQTPEQRYAGEGVFKVSPLGFTEHAPALPMSDTELTDGTFKASGAKARVRLAMRGGGDLDLELWGLHLEGKLRVEGGVATDDVIAGDPDALTGMKAGTIIPLRPAMQRFAEEALTCECAEVDPTKPVIEQSLKGGVFSVRCVQDVIEAAAENCLSGLHGFLCGNLDTICPTLPLFGSLADASTGLPGDDGEPGKDAMSFGAWVSFSPAKLATPPVAPKVKAVPERFVLNWGRSAVFDVLRNDIDALAGRPTVAEVGQAERGTVEIVGEGAAIKYTPTRAGPTTFTYTIGTGDETSQTSVTVVVRENFGAGVRGVDDDATLYLNRGPQHIDGLLDNDDIPESLKPYAEVSMLLNYQNAQAGVAPDRKGIIYEPLDDDETDKTVEYGIGLGAQHSIVGAGIVNLKIRKPESVCGDGWIDGWAEECDPGLDGQDDFCDPTTCKLAACPETGSAPRLKLRDKDSDGSGDGRDPTYFCEAPPEGYVDDIGRSFRDCDDDNKDIHPGADDVCGDGLNNGCEATYDCGADDCFTHESCGESICDDDLDNDSDGGTDCEDPQCNNTEHCTENCVNGEDDDGNGLVDCEDWRDCAGVEPCSESKCEDGVDGDNDGDTDCDDRDCSWVCPEDDCFDGIDDDDNGVTDCDDFGCKLQCPESNCDDEFDDDFDGQTDCEDPGCASYEACQ
jgi:hypothetical protein